MLLVGSAAGAIGYAGYAFARDVWVLLFFGAVVLGFASVIFSQLFAYSRELVDRADIDAADAPLYMSAIRMCFALAWTVGPALAALTLRAFSFRGLFLAASAIYALLFALILRFMREVDLSFPLSSRAPLASGALLAPGAPLASAPPRVRRSRHQRTGAGFVRLAHGATCGEHLVCGVRVGVRRSHHLDEQHVAVRIDVLGGDETQVGMVFSLAPIFELPFMLYFGLLATRVHATRLIQAAIIVASLYYALLVQVAAPWRIYPLKS